MNQILFRAKIALCRLHGCVAEKQLDLLQFPAGCPAQLRGGPATIMRGDTRDAGCGGVWPEQLPHDLLGQTLAYGLIAPIYRPEHVSSACLRFAPVTR